MAQGQGQGYERLPQHDAPAVPELPPALSLLRPSHLLFAYVHPLLRSGTKMQLPPSLASAELLREYRLHETRGADGSKPDVWTALHRMVRWEFWTAGLYLLLNNALLSLNTMLIKYIVSAVSRRSTRETAQLSIAILAVSLLQALFLQQFIHGVFMVGAKVVAVLSSLLFHAALRLRMHRLSPARPIAEVQNVLGKDIASLRDFVAFFHNIWACPLLIAVTVVLLMSLLGVVPGLTSAAIFLLLIPLETRLSQRIKANRRLTSRLADARMALVQEAIEGIRTIRLTDLLPFVLARVTAARRQELASLWTGMCVEMANTVLAQSATLLVTLSTFATYALLNNEALAPERAFAALALINTLGRPVKVLPKCVSMYADALVSAKRLSALLAAAEEPATSAVASGKSLSPAIHVQGLSAVRMPSTAVVKNASFAIDACGMYILTGANASGKSSLLLALLDELTVTSGSVMVAPDGTIAYCGHDSWILNASVRANVCFGCKSDDLDLARYSAAIESSALGPDIAGWEGGHESLLGERGINISGGQKARIALARALYSDAPVLLLDNVLAGLDHATSMHVFRALRRASDTRIVVLSSHDPEHLRMAVGELRVTEGVVELIKLSPAADSHVEALQSSSVYPDLAAPSLQTKGAKQQTPRRQAEPINPYWEYFKACETRMGLAVAASLCAFAALASSDFVIARWTDGRLSVTSYLKLYSCVSMSVLLLHIGRQMLFNGASVQASQVIHDRLLTSILGATFSFFAQTPSGSITSTFSADLSVVDNDISGAVAGVIDAFLSIVSSIVVVVIVSPMYLAVIVPLALAYMYIQTTYRSVSKTLKKEDAAARGPLYSHFYECLTGVEVIRGYKVEYKAIERHHLLLDTQLTARLNWDAVNRWLGIQLDLIGVLVVFAACVCLVWTRNMSGGAAGLMITYAMKTTQNLSFAVRASTAIENTFVSPERIFEMMRVDQEYDPVAKSDSPGILSIDSARHATSCVLECQGLTCRYSTDAMPALIDVSFRLHAGVLTGVCGRTGSGKSTLALALSRSLQHMTGSVFICGVSIFDLRLVEYRKLVQVFPQDSFIFSGTLRDYLDPYRAHSDMKLHSILSSFASTINSIEADGASDSVGELALGSQLSSGGANLSAGQKQILALARAALASNAKVVILDEITSNMDRRVAQQAIGILKSELLAKNMAVVVIAHTLEDIASCDAVLVISNGKLGESRTPKEMTAVTSTTSTQGSTEQLPAE